MNALVSPQSGLARYETACRALAEARAVDEAKDVRDKAEALRIYARQVENKSLEIDAAEIRIRAERRIGELISEQKSTVGLNPGVRLAGKDSAGASVVVEDDRRNVPTLASVGISKDLSSRAQKLAAVPKEEFEAEVGDWRERVSAENARVSTRLEAAGEREIAKGEKAAVKAATKATPPTIESLQADVDALRSELKEARDNARDLADSLSASMTLEEGQEATAKELKRLYGLVSTLESQRDQYMTKCNQLIATVRAKDRQISKLEKKSA